ncbi:glycosyltransferase family 2 protein [Methylococcus sp. EFPC2]|uniref:glycosyltransferase family 2 protein n=1 Tax=Methylococcus sp. EFPC2 TaxID=2812648 RepID=UPI0019688218|nr:glycosyltransferase family A protein [Methylococcus sp. EFPC2]QSA97292.1 glycosyltransferase family 2 protein [Methylococcus sp. EFPC2]
MKLGIVVIGRNEGERLRGCLKSVSSSGSAVIYVDSGSTDSSVLMARNMGLNVIELDRSSPFSAARARNEGFEYLLRHFPEIRYVQFIDGDCTLAPGWLAAAEAALDCSTECAAMIGHLQERNPDATPYNRLCALEWKSVPGVLTDFGALGGISMIRASVFQQLGGFNQEVIAGEDSELGVRMTLAGYKVIKIDHAMAAHDADMHRFMQWWKRAVRGGHAIGQRAHLNGNSAVRDCIKERKSTWFWGVGLPLLTAISAIPSNSLSLLLLGGYLVLGVRIFHYRHSHGDSVADALLYSQFTVLGKFAGGVGLIKFYLNMMLKRYHLIEYK